MGQLSGSVPVQSKPDEVTSANTPCAKEIDVEAYFGETEGAFSGFEKEGKMAEIVQQASAQF